MEGLSGSSSIILAAIINATLQLGLGSLLLLYHASLSKHVKAKTRQIAGSFIAGMGLMSFLLLAAVVFIIAGTIGEISAAWLGGIVGILVALAILAWLFYYRRSEGTELWIPKFIARNLDRRAKKTESRTEAFSLGMTACLAELPFTAVLIIIAANSVVTLSQGWQVITVVLYSLINVLPLFIMRAAIRSGRTVVEIQKWRVKHKNFLRMISGIGYIVLGLFIWAFRVLGGGV